VRDNPGSGGPVLCEHCREMALRGLLPDGAPWARQGRVRASTRLEGTTVESSDGRSGIQVRMREATARHPNRRVRHGVNAAGRSR